MADQKREMNQKEMDKVTGGAVLVDGPNGNCPHKDKTRTGNEREKPFLFFWSRHQVEYYCPNCRQYLWFTEEH